MPAASSQYPLRLEGALDAPLSRWLWLVKWLLVIPHVIVLCSCGSRSSCSPSSRSSRSCSPAATREAIFDFNVGVLRWTWRVGFYSYSALGTDRYPPFTLADLPDYPARLDVDYPEELSRGLVLVKWWLLAIPHYLIVGVFAGGAWAASTRRAITWRGAPASA